MLRREDGRLRRAAKSVATAVAGLLLASGAAIGVRHVWTHPAVASADVLEIHAVHGSSFVPALQGKRPLFILALGSDARPGQQVAGQRSDSIHIIGIDTARHRATILGFPRDSWVPIPGHGVGKITTALTYGGPPLVAQTLENLTGIRIDFWALTSFPGLIRMVDGIGGLSVIVPQVMHDSFSGAFFSRGRHHLNGSQALAFARDRHDFSTGDITRSKNQGVLLVAALSRLHAVFSTRPSELLAWIALLWHNIGTDLSPQTVLDLALAATQVPVKNVNNLVVPSGTGTVGGQSVVFIQPGAQRLYAEMRANGVAG
jgi:LCP family protein required for cell wall assembly